MVTTIGQRQTDRALQLGALFPVDAALKVGLVDEVCEEKEILDRAKQELQNWLKIPGTDALLYVTVSLVPSVLVPSSWPHYKVAHI